MSKEIREITVEGLGEIKRAIAIEKKLKALKKELSEIKSTISEYATIGDDESSVRVRDGKGNSALITLSERESWDDVILHEASVEYGDAFNRLFKTAFKPADKKAIVMEMEKGTELSDLLHTARSVKMAETVKVSGKGK